MQNSLLQTTFPPLLLPLPPFLLPFHLLSHLILDILISRHSRPIYSFRLLSQPESSFRLAFTASPVPVLVAHTWFWNKDTRVYSAQSQARCPAASEV